MTHQQVNLPNGKWPTLPIEFWPIEHREAWDAANRRASPVRRGGRATSLAQRTRKTLKDAYGGFLWWCQATGNLDPQSAPAAQMTHDLMCQFVAARRETVSDMTVFSSVRNLTMMMKCLAPEQDWKWIWRHSGAPRRREALAARRTPRTFPPGLLVHRLLVALQQASEAPLDQLSVVRVRDCLLVALAIHSALRLRNIVAMRLDHNLIHRKSGWEILFDANEMKNQTPILCPVPPVLNPFVDRYVTVDRPRLLTRGGHPSDAVWLSSLGEPLRDQSIWLTFKQIGQEMLGYPINPHSVRHVQATRILNNDPQALTTASLALAHTDISTVSEYYDQGGSKAAQAVWLKLLADLPSGISASKTERDIRQSDGPVPSGRSRRRWSQ
jgi:site-specific recombinase XerD